MDASMMGSVAVLVLSFLSFESLGFIIWYWFGKGWFSWWAADLETVLNALQVWMGAFPLIHTFLFFLACLVTLTYIFKRRVIIVTR